MGFSVAGLIAISKVEDIIFTFSLLCTTPDEREREREGESGGRDRESHLRPTGNGGGGSCRATGLSQRLLND